jgi:hypothetical protein
MSNPGRRQLLAMMGAGALASRVGWAAEPEWRTSPTPRALVNSIGVRLRKSRSGATILAVNYAGTLDAGDRLHAVGGQLEFSRQPTEAGLARAVKKALILKAAREPGVSLKVRDITVVGPTFL